MKKRFIIKTTDGNRYDTNDIPLRIEKAGIEWLYFPVKVGVGTMFINTANIVSLTEKEVDE